MAPPPRHDDTLTRVSTILETSVLALAAAALAFRASVYWLLPAPPGQPYGTGDVVDFALGLLLFALSGACAATGVMMSARSVAQPRAYRPVLVGITTFVAYYFVHPHVPRLL